MGEPGTRLPFCFLSSFATLFSFFSVPLSFNSSGIWRIFLLFELFLFSSDKFYSSFLRTLVSHYPSHFLSAKMATDQEEAVALKLQGNKAFAQHDWPVAVDFYNQAIAKYDQDPSFFCNRAQVRYRRSWRHILESRVHTG
jgi:hypothetical protein